MGEEGGCSTADIFYLQYGTCFYSRQYYKASMINFYNSFFWVLALLLLSNPLQAQLTTQLQDPEFLKLINNYFGCKTWVDGICTQCSAQFYFNKNGVCCQVKPQCKVFNIGQGICEQCYEGYEVFDGKCILRDLKEDRNYGCRKWENNQCVECSLRWFFNSNGECQKISDLCRVWQANGICQTCYKGYSLIQNTCIIDINNIVPGELDPFCALWEDLVCLRCAERAFFDDNGKCTPVDDNCRTWDAFEGFCLSCYKGYDLNSGICLQSQDNLREPTDLGCAQWDWENQICLRCSQRWVVGSDGICVSISDLCATFNDDGTCTSCFKGFQLQNGVCVLSDVNSKLPMDLGCKTWDWDNQRCLECSQRFVMADNSCVFVSDDCRTWGENGLCLTCYKGYELQSGICVRSQISSRDLDIGCREWDWDNQICLKCSERWVMGPSGCIPISDFCQTFNSDGQCLTCYKGFKLQLGECIFQDIDGPSDIGCARWNWDSQVCLDCSERWVMVSGKCFPVSDHCATHNETGQCTSCYKGYNLQQGQCLRVQIDGFFDIGCASWDWDNRICLKCSTRWVMREGGCIPVSDDCATHDSNGLCTSCFKGYQLSSDNECLISENNFPIDVGCRQWDWDAQICLRCSHRYIMNENNRCIQVSDHCAIFNDAGQCTFCYKGYDLIDGQCIYSISFNTRIPFDLGCSQWDWDNQICLKCSQRWVMSSDGCVKVPDECNTYDQDGRCTSCYLGYGLQNGLCSVRNLLCREADLVGNCVKCYNGYVLYRGGCTPLSQLADIALYYAECCPEKLEQLRREGRI